MVRTCALETKQMSILKSALNLQEGEKVPRLTIEKDGMRLTWKDLENMTVKNLETCDISLLGGRIQVNAEGISWEGFGGARVGKYAADVPAAEALYAMYMIPISYLHGKLATSF